ncbi:uncharacterized protein LOC108164910 [Drosophila miranda]|uniref:uncharacterized protein LOC108164910 n=1 Tax=Drosophila miranda TaxID=7229 RepID=UPI0007E7BDF0|nr:uncharacterized protein LOC108164910 [Drosophila miranda]
MLSGWMSQRSAPALTRSMITGRSRSRSPISSSIFRTIWMVFSSRPIATVIKSFEMAAPAAAPASVKRLPDPDPKIAAVAAMPKITITSSSTTSSSSCSRGAAVPKSPDGLTALVAKKSLTSMSDEEIIQENLKEILDLKSREERKANGRLVAVIVCFLVIFLAIYHAWIQDALAGVLVPAGIMLSYFAWVVVLAKRDKHKRAMFEKHIEEVAMKNKSELEEKHSRMKHSHGHGHGHTVTAMNADQQSCSGSASSSLHYVNELLPNGEHRKKQRRHRQRHGEGERPGRAHRATGATTEATVHRSGGAKRPSIRQKLFGQSIAHVKLVETQSDSMDSTGGGPTAPTGPSSEKRKRLQRMDNLPMPQVVRMSSAP